MSNVPVLGTNVGPISFPGISSGLDVNGIINKLVSLTQAQAVVPNNQIASLTAANSELIHINSLLSSVQNALTALSSPALFDSFNAQVSDPTFASASGIPGVAATPGVYVVTKQTAATSTQVVSDATAGHSEKDLIAGVPADQVALAQSFAAVTPSNGTSASGQGSITVDGQTVKYNVNTDSLQTILSRIQTAVVSSGADAGFTISETTVGGANDVVQINATKPVSLGSAGDSGNLLQVLKLDQAQIQQTGPSTFQVTGTSGVGGINQAATLDGGNNANFKNVVTPFFSSGTFTINGVAISVNTSTDNLASVLARINSSAAGVNASYNAATNQVTLTAKATGPQSIVLGAAGDTSNFLDAAGLTNKDGFSPATTLGQQASVTVQNPAGTNSTIFSNSNAITSAIPGITLNITASTATPYTVTVSQDQTQLVNAVNAFVSAYNGAITEINTATQPPVVTALQPGQSAAAGATTTQLGGGVLFENGDVQSLKDRLTSIVTGLFGNASDPFNSLSQIGVQVDDSVTVLTTANNGQSNGGQNQSSGTDQLVQTTNFAGTDGAFAPLDTTKLEQAFQNNPTQVQGLLNEFTNQLGTYLGNVTGLPTSLNSGLVGVLAAGQTSTLQGFENSITDQIGSLQKQVSLINDEATLQATQLRAEFIASESTIAGLQAEQAQLGAFGVSSSGH